MDSLIQYIIHLFEDFLARVYIGYLVNKIKTMYLTYISTLNLKLSWFSQKNHRNPDRNPEPLAMEIDYVAS